MAERVDHRWTVGPYTFEAVSRHGFPEPQYPPVMYRYKIADKRVDNELYESLDRAMVAAVGARHMGPRGAGGPGVGTAADWFCRMIDLDEAEAEERAQAPSEPVFCQDELCPWTSAHAAGEPDGCTGGTPASGDCPGSGQSWTTSTNAPDPACRRCGATFTELGVDRPQMSGYHHLGVVPTHGLAPIGRASKR
jgi:hypothetical protein